MKVFRLRYVIETFSLFTGIIFLNMSFALAEISALKLDKDRQMAKAISILIAGCAAEEEPGGSTDEDTSATEIDLIFSHSTRSESNSNSSYKKNAGSLSLGVPRFGNYEIFSPPPEV